MKFELLRTYTEENKINISEDQINKYEKFTSMLIEKNKVMNLTAIDDEQGIEVKHLIDSLAGATVINELGLNDFSILDVGCGAGFPGMPLAIAYPNCSFTLLDSLNKRINFVHETASQLGLSKVRGIAARAEDYKERESFDYVTSRAVARMNVLLEYMLPFAKVGGYCILYKSGEYEDELTEAAKAIEILGGEYVKTVTFDLPADGGRRSLVLIKKISSTPEKYPRRAGKPSKSPIK